MSTRTVQLSMQSFSPVQALDIMFTTPLDWKVMFFDAVGGDLRVKECLFIREGASLGR